MVNIEKSSWKGTGVRSSLRNSAHHRILFCVCARGAVALSGDGGDSNAGSDSERINCTGFAGLLRLAYSQLTARLHSYLWDEDRPATFPLRKLSQAPVDDLFRVY